eukprot:4704266-Pleurochrysis_carterae.AAC.3
MKGDRVKSEGESEKSRSGSDRNGKLEKSSALPCQPPQGNVSSPPSSSPSALLLARGALRTLIDARSLPRRGVQAARPERLRRRSDLPRKQLTNSGQGQLTPIAPLTIQKDTEQWSKSRKAGQDTREKKWAENSRD